MPASPSSSAQAAREALAVRLQHLRKDADLTGKETVLVPDALEMALWQRDRDQHTFWSGELVRHSDAGSQCTSFRLADHLEAAGIAASIGSVGDAYDNALMESTIGLFKTELIKPRRPWKTLPDVDLATAEYIDWCNHRRLHGETGHAPPVEYENNHYLATTKPQVTPNVRDLCRARNGSLSVQRRTAFSISTSLWWPCSPSWLNCSPTTETNRRSSQSHLVTLIEQQGHNDTRPGMAEGHSGTASAVPFDGGHHQVRTVGSLEQAGDGPGKDVAEVGDADVRGMGGGELAYRNVR
ncbi:integrase core domain-containing protein [Streptomyces sp. enrichment culture]|uniref:integrase core domain-containing protein n=1 Tax=Streptomyces sp. enrichment culture TaxID=1795815 RepID=UPI003F559658